MVHYFTATTSYRYIVPAEAVAMSSTTPPDAFTVTGTKGTGSGRSLTSRVTHAPGSLIATFTHPLLILPAGPAAKTVCNHCLAHKRPVKACTGCKAVVYCGPACQKANWAVVHKLECKVFKRVRASVDKDWLPTPVRALVQVLLRWDGDDVLRAAFGALEGNVDQFKPRQDVWKDIGLQAYGGLVYAGRRENDDQLHMARDILCKVRAMVLALPAVLCSVRPGEICLADLPQSIQRSAVHADCEAQIQTNAFDRTDADTDQAGIFLHPTLAMINHSCVPNAAVSFKGRQALLRAELPIKEGDEINISYIGTSNSVAIYGL